MNNRHARQSERRARTTRLVCSIGQAAIVFGLAFATNASADEKPSEASDGFMPALIDALVHGKPTLDVNARWENATIDQLDTSNSATIRTRLGYGTKPLHGVSGFLEFENVATPRSSAYFDGIDTNDANKSIVADPETLEANRFWLLFSRPDLAESSIKIGRQRIKLDDDRWVGNVRRPRYSWTPIRGEYDVSGGRDEQEEAKQGRLAVGHAGSPKGDRRARRRRCVGTGSALDGGSQA